MDAASILSLAMLAFGLILEIFVFCIMAKKKQGFGVNNTRIVGLIAVVTLTTALVISGSQKIEPAMAILGAVAGYLFGYSEKKAAEDN